MAEATADLDAPGARSQGASGIRRYSLLERIGQGGVGVVYTAHDARLDRKVAIKVLQREESPQARARFQREAQALARLHHPNVVTVFDAGEINERPFLAMELVDGTSLREWLRAGPRGWREIVAVMAQAGRGLAAAHRAGLIHRDVKPDNILVARDGTARIADFGLARALADTELDGEDGPSPTTPSPLEQTVTREGVALGTPGYMAPERQLDARSDQYSFCVSLGRALEGVKAPAFMQRVVSRGRSREPALRYPSMDALVVDLGRDPARTWRRVGLAGGLAAVCVAAVVVATRLSAATPCQDAAQEMAGVWDAETAATVHAAFAASANLDAEDAFRRVAGQLDGYRAGWIAMRTEACQATAVRHTQSEALLDRREACLDGRRTELRALTGLLAGKLDRGAVDHAVQAVAGLDDLAGCADAEALMAEVPPSRDPRIAALEAQIAGADKLRDLGRYDEAEAIGLDLVAEAPTIDYLPTKARALLALPNLVSTHGQMSDPMRVVIEAAARQGLETAAAAKLTTLEASTWPVLMWILVRSGQASAAMALETPARVAAAGAGNPELRANLEQELAFALQEQGKLTEALAHAEEALRLAEAAHGAEDMRVSGQLKVTANILMRLGRFDDARALMSRRLAISERALGPNHPDVADALADRGEAEHSSLQHFEEAHADFERALAIQTRTAGPDSPEALNTLGAIGALWTAEEHYEEAVAVLARFLATIEGAAAPDKPTTASALLNLGAAEMQLGDLDSAALHLRRARLLVEEITPPGHPFRGVALLYLAALDLRLGKLDDALAEVDQAIAILDAAATPGTNGDALMVRAAVLTARGHAADAVAPGARAVELYETNAGKDGLSTADGLYVYGDALLAAGRVDDALVALERAEAIRAVQGHDLLQRGRTRFALARARWAKGDHEGAHAAAALALADFKAARFGKTFVAEVEAWRARN